MPDPGTERHGPTLEFTRETEGLPQARKTELVALADGDEFELQIIPVKKRIGESWARSPPMSSMRLVSTSAMTKRCLPATYGAIAASAPSGSV